MLLKLPSFLRHQPSWEVSLPFCLHDLKPRSLSALDDGAYGTIILGTLLLLQWIEDLPRSPRLIFSFHPTDFSTELETSQNPGLPTPSLPFSGDSKLSSSPTRTGFLNMPLRTGIFIGKMYVHAHKYIFRGWRAHSSPSFAEGSLVPLKGRSTAGLLQWPPHWLPCLESLHRLILTAAELLSNPAFTSLPKLFFTSYQMGANLVCLSYCM